MSAITRRENETPLETIRRECDAINSTGSDDTACSIFPGSNDGCYIEIEGYSFRFASIEIEDAMPLFVEYLQSVQ